MNCGWFWGVELMEINSNLLSRLMQMYVKFSRIFSFRGEEIVWVGNIS